ncbi:alpha/beta fold hydrolase [Hoyosella altamirensis]|uniref:Pimeloyl-ACP methyl ester carboxylesterase n=1 Tax=Hoyosella altamirensis TaxID=616997 RepID=A0A839RNA0_9ACTN|nr:alpha/beta hydrolase [Hoyosella altamirensis]MBB3037668.1 pimeloyl-ACP methyl ester carboxylesterase [Hoyosella altamirensis]
MSTSTAMFRADPRIMRSMVLSDDGVPLAVTECGDRSAPLTLVFIHGHCLRADSWSALREHLAGTLGYDIRMVSYDHRGHGESGSAPAGTYTIDQLGRDLDAVLRAVAPHGPVVLVGHSMGGMTAMSYARQFPHMIGNRVIGVGLIATASHGLTDAGVGQLLRHPLAHLLHRAVDRAPALMEIPHRLSRRIARHIIRATAFGEGRVSPHVTSLVTAMVNETALATKIGFLRSLLHLNESLALSALQEIPALVLCGSADHMTPFHHSAALASALPAADLVRVEGAGHSVILERTEAVAHALAHLLRRALQAPDFALAS